MVETYGGALRMDIYVPKGSRVLSMSGLEPGGTELGIGEAEVLLPRGTKYRVIEVFPEEGRIVVEVIQ